MMLSSTFPESVSSPGSATHASEDQVHCAWSQPERIGVSISSSVRTGYVYEPVLRDDVLSELTYDICMRNVLALAAICSGKCIVAVTSLAVKGEKIELKFKCGVRTDDFMLREIEKIRGLVNFVVDERDLVRLDSLIHRNINCMIVPTDIYPNMPPDHDNLLLFISSLISSNMIEGIKGILEWMQNMVQRLSDICDKPQLGSALPYL